MNKLDILFTIPHNTVRRDTPTVLVQILEKKSELSGKFFCLDAFLIPA